MEMVSVCHRVRVELVPTQALSSSCRGSARAGELNENRTRGPRPLQTHPLWSSGSREKRDNRWGAPGHLSTGGSRLPRPSGPAPTSAQLALPQGISSHPAPLKLAPALGTRRSLGPAGRPSRQQAVPTVLLPPPQPGPRLPGPEGALGPPRTPPLLRQRTRLPPWAYLALKRPTPDAASAMSPPSPPPREDRRATLHSRRAAEASPPATTVTPSAQRTGRHLCRGQ